MRHLVAFVVIGLVIGAAGGWVVGGKARSPWPALIGGLVGALVGGEILENAVHGSVAKYGSLVAAIIVAAVAAWLGRRLSPER